jgi:hypothetical protein
MKTILLGVLAGLVVFTLAGADFAFAKTPSHKPTISRSKDGITLSFSEKTYKEKEKIQVPVESKNPFVLKGIMGGKDINALTGKDVEQKFKTETLTTKTTLVTTTVKNSKKEERRLRILFRNSERDIAQWDVTLDAKGLIKKGKDSYMMDVSAFDRVTEIEVHGL